MEVQIWAWAGTWYRGERRPYRREGAPLRRNGSRASSRRTGQLSEQPFYRGIASRIERNRKYRRRASASPARRRGNAHLAGIARRCLPLFPSAAAALSSSSSPRAPSSRQRWPGRNGLTTSRLIISAARGRPDNEPEATA